MRQFDIYPNPSERSRAVAPFVVLLQSHLFAALPTVIVAPLLRDDDGAVGYSGVSVPVTHNDELYVISIPELAGVDASLMHGAVGDVRRHEDEIRRALDRLFTGF